MDEVSVLLKNQTDILSQLKENIKQLEAGFKALKKLDALNVKEEKQKKIKETKKKPVEAPVEAPEKAPVETPVEAHVETPVEAPVEASAEAPVEASEKKKRTYKKK